MNYRKFFALSSLLIIVLALFWVTPIFAQDDLDQEKWCDGVNIRFFAGGAEGDAFASIVYRGALAAERDLGANVDYVFSGWDAEVMVQQLREAVAQAPDGIAMMGHPGDDAVMPLAAEASEAGIIMMYQNVPLDKVVAMYGGGYVGAQQYEQGHALGVEAIRQFGFGSGDKAIIVANLAQRERAQREIGVWDAFEEVGMEIIHVDSPPNAGSDPNLLIPSLTAAITDNPDIVAVVFNGGQTLGNTQTYFEAAGLAAGAVKAIGFDTNGAIMQGFEDGWIHLTADQQPYLQGYLPILSICQTAKLGLAPLNVDTGAGFVDASNYEQVRALAEAGYR